MGFLNKLFGNKEDDSKNHFEQGKALILDGDLDEGIKLFRRAISLYPNITDKIYNVAHALHGGAESKNKAVGGTIYYSDGIVELDTAIAVIELLSAFESNKADIWFKLGVLYDNHCYFDKAIKAYERAANLDPEGPDGADALHNLGMLHFNKGKGILGMKREEASGYHAYSMNQNDDFVNAEKTALKALGIAKTVYLRDPSFQTNLINIHILLREIYNNVAFEDKNNQQFVLKGETALEHCLEIYKLDPNNSAAISWLKKAEKNTGERYLFCKECGSHLEDSPDPLTVGIPCKCGVDIDVYSNHIDKVKGLMVKHSDCNENTFYVPPTVWCAACKNTLVPNWRNLVVYENTSEVAREMTDPHLKVMRQLARQLIEKHGNLVEIRCVACSNSDHIELVFADKHEILIDEHSGNVDITMMKFGYHGTGPKCFHTFLNEAGFNVSFEDVATMKAGTVLRH